MFYLEKQRKLYMEQENSKNLQKMYNDLKTTTIGLLSDHCT